jgi:hypothetical protein
VAGRRGRAAGATIAAAVLFGAVSGCGTTEQISTAPTASASTATTPASTLVAEKAAVAQLQAWLANPQAGTLTYNTIQVGSTVNVMTILTGPFDPTTGEAALTGSIEMLGSSSTTQPSTALELDQKVYTTIPAALQTGDLLGKLWESAPVRTTWAADAVYSGWWQTLNQVGSVRADGVTSLSGTTADLYSENLDLASLKNIPKQLLDSDAIKKAGTTKVEVDLYTAMGSGTLIRVTYKFGLPVQIDAAATAKSSAGYEVDMTGFADASATPAASPSPMPTAPDPATVGKDAGDADLAALLPF